MSYKITEKKQGEVTLEIVVEKTQLEKITKMVAEELSKSIKTPGFRPGKAPLIVVEREVGKDQFWAEVVDKAIPEAYFEAIVAEGISVIAQPMVKLKEMIPSDHITFEATVATMPEIKDFKYEGFKIKAQQAKVTSNDIESALLDLANRMTEDKDVKRAAKSGDKVEIDFEGTMKGIPFDGGKSQNHPLILGSGNMIPGFEEAIIGKQPGEEFDFDITFPADYHAKNLAGQKVNFKVKLNLVSERITPKIDDEAAKKFGLESLEKLKEELKKQLLFEKELEAKRSTEEKVLEAIIEKNKIEAPSVLVAEEVHRMVHEAEHNLSHSGLTLDKFLEMSKKTLPELEEEMKPEAEKRIKIGVVLGEVSKLEKIDATEKEVEAEVERIIATSPEGTSKDDVRAAYKTAERERELKNSLVIRKTINVLWTKNVTE